jgi:hypothetical protein
MFPNRSVGLFRGQAGNLVSPLLIIGNRLIVYRMTGKRIIGERIIDECGFWKFWHANSGNSGTFCGGSKGLL